MKWDREPGNRKSLEIIGAVFRFVGSDGCAAGKILGRRVEFSPGVWDIACMLMSIVSNSGDGPA